MPEKISNLSRLAGSMVLACVTLVVILVFLGSFVHFSIPDRRNLSSHAQKPAIHALVVRSDIAATGRAESGPQDGKLPELTFQPVQIDPAWRLWSIQPNRGQLLVYAKLRASSESYYLLTEDVGQLALAPVDGWQPFRSRLPRRIRQLPGSTGIDPVLLCDEPVLQAVPSDARILGAGISATSYAYLIRYAEKGYLISGSTNYQSDRKAQWLDFSTLFGSSQPTRALIGPDILYARSLTAEEQRKKDQQWDDITHNRSLVVPCGEYIVLYNWPRDLLALVKGSTVYTAHPETCLEQGPAPPGEQLQMPPVMATAAGNYVYAGFAAGEARRRLLLVRFTWADDPPVLAAEKLGFIALDLGTDDELSLAVNGNCLLVMCESFDTHKTEVYSVDLPLAK